MTPPVSPRRWSSFFASRAVDGAAARRRRDPRFASNFGLKGLYSYKSGTYAGHAFFGTGGSEAEETAPFDDGNKHKVDVPAPAAAVKSGAWVIAQPGLAKARGHQPRALHLKQDPIGPSPEEGTPKGKGGTPRFSPSAKVTGATRQSSCARPPGPPIC